MYNISRYGSAVYIGIAMVYPILKTKTFFIFTFNLNIKVKNVLKISTVQKVVEL